ncbi:exonuclease domain-containing protein [Streptomyces sp. NPDC102381]|uniref:exonuclease domain-containing protein n=1 Tax=Streptomyces sp. NPDC102381 TaxID=3366164 RepID=UPI0037F3792C
MSSTTAAEAEIPSSRTEPEEVPAKLKVYGWGQAPAHLRTQTQLAADRLKLAPGQQPVAYLYIQRHGQFDLYDPADAVKMKPLGSATKAAMTARRTCPECGKVRKYPVRTRCSVCQAKAYEAQRRREARTCWDCREVFARRLPKEHHRCGPCRSGQLAAWRQKAVEWVEEVTVCGGEGCAVKLVTKKEAREHQRQQGLRRSWWRRAAHWPLRCAPCTTAEEQRRAEQRARWEREEQERREAERRVAEARVRWAAEALADPDVVVLDTETTGLDDPRIVEIAVVSSAGEVLLDTLVNPGVPIPEEASQIHGITDSDVASAATFSQLLDGLTAVLSGKRVLIYNKWFDIGALQHELTLHYLDRAAREFVEEASAEALREGARERSLGWARDPVVWAGEQAGAWLGGMTFEDVMIPYSDWVGDWSEYHGNNRWQPLNGGHRAAGDCRAVLDCLRAMGRRYNGGLDEGEAA